MYKILALDLDGTLTNSKKEITPQTLDVLIQAQQKGIRLVLASGRPLPGIMPLAEQLHLKDYCGYILAFNGGLIIDCSTGESIYQKVLDTSVYKHLYKVGNTEDFKILSYLDNCIACEDIENQYVRYEAKLNKMKLQKLNSFLDEINFPEPKCLIVGNEDKLSVLEKELVAYYEGKMSIYRSEPFFLEILPLGIDKAKCLEYLLNHLDLKREELMVCGDGFNDLSMIKFAGLGVAMSNAQTVVKEAADYITQSNEKDGVAVAVKRFILK
ncbi:MAG: Cof-type HAD-IIB family hydrolase [Bacteroidaceae bacterium]|nr:Cof-type HAD-IIB family hydrolase [Bacteroidaceae bacterium]